MTETDTTTDANGSRVVEMDPMTAPDDVQPADGGRCSYSECDSDADYDVTLRDVTFGVCESCAHLNLPSVPSRVEDAQN